MATVSDVLQAVEQLAPPQYAFDWDRIGLQLGDRSASVRRGVVALDPSQAAFEQVQSVGAQVLVTHHPLIWDPMKSIVADHPTGRLALQLAQLGCASIAAHTNWDCAPGGINDALADALGLTNVVPFGPGQDRRQLKLVTFVPESAVMGLIEALSAAGAGQIGDYEQCAFLSPGEGTFRGAEGTRPTIGQAGSFERVPEVRLEMVLRESSRAACERALRAQHPYEEPAYDFYPLAMDVAMPAGRIGEIGPMTLAEFRQHVEKALGAPCLAWGPPDRAIRRVGIIGGAADRDWTAAQHARADAYLTGEIRHNITVEAGEAEFPVLAAGHFATENPGMIRMMERLRELLPSVEWTFAHPEAGAHGRPLA